MCYFPYNNYCLKIFCLVFILLTFVMFFKTLVAAHLIYLLYLTELCLLCAFLSVDNCLNLCASMFLFCIYLSHLAVYLCSKK